MSKKEPRPVDGLTYEEAIAELDAIVAGLEASEHALNESMELFERGQALAKHCSLLLEKAELKVKELVGETPAEYRENT